MPEVAEFRSALDSVGRPATVVGRDLWLRECAGGTITRLESPQPGPALTGYLAALGIADLPALGLPMSGGAGLLLTHRAGHLAASHGRAAADGRGV